jgi:hypothetical protein
MVARNEITGDKIKTKVSNSDDFKKGYDEINWKVKMGHVEPTANKPMEPVQLELPFDEERIDIIGQNGNVGYEEETL